eukprot:g3867.t1
MHSGLDLRYQFSLKRNLFTNTSRNKAHRIAQHLRTTTLWSLNATDFEPVETEAEVATTERFAFDVSVQVIPHPNKVAYGGEDAYFIAGDTSFGVADGVGGWTEGGVNPAEYSRSIMALSQEGITQSETVQDLKSVLDQAHQKTKLPGSCTACLVKVDPDNGVLEGLNIGDSGFLILRGNEVVLRTKPQQHFFDCPKQLADYPDHCGATDYARDGDDWHFSLDENDLILMATDGFWDNVFDKQILDFTSNQYGSRKTVEELAEGLARLAQRNALDEETPSPYTIAALEEGYEIPWYEKVLKTRIRDGRVKVGTLTGGKRDDITVIVAKVKKGLFPPPSVEVPETESP